MREESEQHEYNVEMRPRAYSTFTPSKVDTDSCLIRIVNTCQDTSLRCSKPNIKANFHPLFPPSDPDPLNSWSRNYRLFWLRFEEAEVEPRGRKNLVVGMREFLLCGWSVDGAPGKEFR